MSILLKSALKEAADALPDALKPNQIVPALKKAGVKDEELSMSGVGVLDYENLPKDAKGRVSTSAVKNAPRLDEFSTSERYVGGDKNFGREAAYSHVLPEGVEPRAQNYVERVYKFAHPEGVISGSSHFGDKDYLMHTRAYDDLIGDADTRVVAEIQSDLHQNNKAQPLTNRDEVAELYRMAQAALSTADEDEVAERMANVMFDRHTNIPEELIEPIAQFLVTAKSPDEVIAAFEPKKHAAAWETSWARKGLENEIALAKQEGKQQVAIPLKSAPVDKVFSGSFVDNSVASQVVDKFNSGTVGMSDIKQLYDAIIEKVPEELRDKDYVRRAVEHGLNEAWAKASDREIALHELTDWIDEGVEFNADTSGGIGSLVRSGGVQKWYETYIGPLAQKLAKQTNSEFKTEVKDGIEYGVIKFGPDSKTDFKLYSAGGGLAAYMAYQQGYSEEEVSKYMREQGFGEDEIAAANAQQAQIATAKAQGYTDEEIQQYLQSTQPKPVQEAEVAKNPDGTPKQPGGSLPTPEKQEAAKAITSGAVLPADELLANLQVIKPDMSSVTTRIAAFFGDDEAVKDAQATEEAAIANIKALGAERGLQFDWDGEEWTMMTENGPQIVTPGFMAEIAAAKGEAIGGIGGAIAGGRAGVAAGGASPLHKAIGGALGAAVGGIAGAAAGTELDYLYSSMQLQEEMSAEIAAHKALTAAEAAAYGEIVGLGLYKSGAALWKGAVRAKDFILDGNSEGARKALRDTMFLTDDEINEVVEQFEKTVDTTGMSRAQKEITAVATTLPGAEDLVRAASSIDSTASRSVVKGIDDRAKQLQAEVDKTGTENIGKTIQEDFKAYTTEVKQFYNGVKRQAAEAPRAKYYKFNFDKTAIMPVLENLADNISSPATRERFLLRMNQARKYADGRTFADLLELRQVVNEFRFNSKIVNARDYNAVDKVIQSIDARIEAGARFVMPKPQEWLDEFATARAKYSQMKTLEKNVLVKTLNRPGITPELVSQSLIKYSNAVDGTYERVMEVLPKQMRELAEADIIKTLTNKYTAGEAGGMNAVQFPMLAEDLSTRSFVSPQARQMKEAITQLADTFKNDVMLSKHSGMMRVPQFQSYLTADPVVRAKFEIASTVFNKIKQSVPGSKSSREIALIKLTAEFLEKPLNAKTVGQLKEGAKDIVDVDEAILSVQREQAEAIATNMDKSGVKVPVYGKGDILSSAGSGSPAMEIPAHRIASQAIIKSVADAEGLTVDSKTALDSALKRYGFKAVQYGSDKVRLLK